MRAKIGRIRHAKTARQAGGVRAGDQTSSWPETHIDAERFIARVHPGHQSRVAQLNGRDNIPANSSLQLFVHGLAHFVISYPPICARRATASSPKNRSRFEGEKPLVSDVSP